MFKLDTLLFINVHKTQCGNKNHRKLVVLKKYDDQTMPMAIGSSDTTSDMNKTGRGINSIIWPSDLRSNPSGQSPNVDQSQLADSGPSPACHAHIFHLLINLFLPLIPGAALLNFVC